MHFHAIKSLVTCALGAAVMAGCASSPSTPTQASMDRSVQSGKVIGVENTAAPGQSVAGSSAGGMTASSAPTVVTVLFADGTQGSYSVAQEPAEAFVVGDPVRVVTDGDEIMIVSP